MRGPGLVGCEMLMGRQLGDLTTVRCRNGQGWACLVLTRRRSLRELKIEDKDSDFFGIKFGTYFLGVVRMIY